MRYGMWVSGIRYWVLGTGDWEFRNSLIPKFLKPVEDPVRREAEAENTETRNLKPLEDAVVFYGAPYAPWLMNAAATFRIVREMTN